MFDISFGELILVVAIAIIFLKPEDVPKVLRAVAKAIRWVKETSREFTSIFDDLAKESGIKDIERDLTIKPTLVKGDDGKYYEAYDLANIPSPLAGEGKGGGKYE